MHTFIVISPSRQTLDFVRGLHCDRFESDALFCGMAWAALVAVSCGFVKGVGGLGRDRGAEECVLKRVCVWMEECGPSH